MLPQTLTLWLIEGDAATLLLDINPSERVRVPINKRGNGVQSLFRAAASLRLSEPPVSAKIPDNHLSMYLFIILSGEDVTVNIAWEKDSGKALFKPTLLI